MKLPYRLREGWRSYVCEFQKKERKRPQFPELVAFLEKHVRILSDPVYGDIHDRPTKAKDKIPAKVKPKSSGSSFATSLPFISLLCNLTLQTLKVLVLCVIVIMHWCSVVH